MSDPMTNSEVEDILSSIRRLVSDEKRSDPTVPTQEQSAPDRLVLTPSLRVADDRIPKPDPLIESTGQGDSTQTIVAEESRADSADVDDEPCTDKHIAAPFLLDGQLGRSEDASGESIDDTASTSDADLEVDAVDFKDLETRVDAEQVADDAADAPETLGAKIAALETLIAGRAEEWEPDQAGTDAYAGTEPPAMDWDEADIQNDADAEDVAALAHDRDIADAMPKETEELDAKPDAELSAFSTDGRVLDEDALRELVSEIVRQELQGVLGERITRNVRKLVRRELHRALAAEDLE
ncbi:hypothetical protein [Tateyamaria pelophila]|uniref:hypothetical protein n=1 Tax=Tateyamaria pelophila TaxID=328415 RepID=UPI001CBC4BCF|nr:hypothetical protein [Tateyamaria pelophila]